MDVPVGRLVRAVAVTGVVLVIWAALASRRPALTYHFAPLIAALGGPWFSQWSYGRLVGVEGIAVVAACLAPTLGVAVALEAADRLQGPTFWGESGAFGEAFLFAVLGAAIGTAVLMRPRPARS